VLEADLLANPP